MLLCFQFSLLNYSQDLVLFVHFYVFKMNALNCTKLCVTNLMLVLTIL
jgi:hypothetical protein